MDTQQTEWSGYHDHKVTYPLSRAITEFEKANAYTKSLYGIEKWSELPNKVEKIFEFFEKLRNVRKKIREVGNID